MVPFESFGTVSYSHFIVTMALSCIIFETERDTGRKSRFFSYRLHSTPQIGRSMSSEYCHTVWYKKARMVWLYPEGEKSFMMCLAVSTEYPRGLTSWDSIQSALCIASRGKNLFLRFSFSISILKLPRVRLQRQRSISVGLLVQEKYHSASHERRHLGPTNVRNWIDLHLAATNIIAIATSLRRLQNTGDNPTFIRYIHSTSSASRQWRDYILHLLESTSCYVKKSFCFIA